MSLDPNDFDYRPVIAVIADGATIHTNIPGERTKELQRADMETAFHLGASLADKGWRVALPGYNGLCRAVIEGIVSKNGAYIVVAERRSITFNDQGVPLLPTSDGHGQYIVTNTIGESKSVLFALSDTLVYLKGGLNTFDIFTDHFVLEQTSMFRNFHIHGTHRRKLILFNDDGFWQPSLDMTEHMLAAGLADEQHRPLLKRLGSTDSRSPIIHIAYNVEEIIDQIGGSLYEGKPWLPTDASEPILFVPPHAINLAYELSRALVMRKIRPVEPFQLKERLGKIRKINAPTTLNNGPILTAISQPCVAVYCGSRIGHDPIHVEAAKATGRMLRECGVTLVYGGSEFGIMGAIANGFTEADCDAHPAYALAVTPLPFLTGGSTAANEGFNPRITATIAVPGMQERKMLMTTLSDISIMLTGGWGSLDEALEEVRLCSQNACNRHLVILNVKGYWNHFPELFAEAIKRGYMSKESMDCVSIVNSVQSLRSAVQKLLRNHEIPQQNPTSQLVLQ